MKIKNNISRNIVTYRKRCNLTQLQLAEKLSYSDKAISKWERGEAIPDTLVMLQLCEIFGITLNDLVADKPKKAKKLFFTRNKLIIPFLSCIGTILISILVFVIGILTHSVENAWISFVYALNVDFIVLLVFSLLWWGKIPSFFMTSGLIWTSCLSAYLSATLFLPFENNEYWMIFLIGVPIQLFFIFFFLLKKRDKNI